MERDEYYYVDYPEFFEDYYEERTEDDYDFEDVDCEDCGLKFYIRPSLYKDGKKPWPHKCERCQKGLPPLYEY